MKSIKNSLLFVFLLAGIAAAQFDSAAVLGSVQDDSGLTVSDVKVTVENVPARQIQFALRFGF